MPEPAFPVYVTMPEPPASRAQSIPGSILSQWLSGVIQRDLDGYAVITGRGHTMTVVFGDGQTLGSVVTRGSATDLDDVLVWIEQAPDEGCFVMTCKLPSRTGRMLAALLQPPFTSIAIRPDENAVLPALASHLPQAFDGALVVRSADIDWHVMLLSSGRLLASYCADDRALSMDMSAINVLNHLDELQVAVHPSMIDEGAAETAEGSWQFGEHTQRVEASMIELLSLFEHRLSRLERSEQVPEHLTAALAEVCDAAHDLDASHQDMRLSRVPRHPVLAAHWDQQQGRVLTTELLSTYAMASIPDAWVSASDALLLAIDRAVELRLTWLAVDDDFAAATLREALDDLLQQSRVLLKEWRMNRIEESRARQTKKLTLMI